MLALAFHEQRSVKNFGVNFDHLLFIFAFSLSFLHFKFFYFWFNHSFGLRNISNSAFSQNFSYIWSELLLSHFSYSRSPFFLLNFLNLFLLLFLSHIDKSQMFLCDWNVDFMILMFWLLIFWFSVNLRLDSRTRTIGTIFKRKWKDFNGFFLLFLI